ncbi:hypothetical protein LPN04_31155 [Rugamonas sp. A1-17]|nr:hypothetical protein [Rugamonas sp. A1-17]
MLAIAVVGSVSLCLLAYIRTRKNIALSLGLAMAMFAVAHLIVVDSPPEVIGAMPFVVALALTEDGIVFALAVLAAAGACAVYMTAAKRNFTR